MIICKPPCITSLSSFNSASLYPQPLRPPPTSCTGCSRCTTRTTVRPSRWARWQDGQGWYPWCHPSWARWWSCSGRSISPRAWPWRQLSRGPRGSVAHFHLPKIVRLFSRSSPLWTSTVTGTLLRTSLSMAAFRLNDAFYFSFSNFKWIILNNIQNNNLTTSCSLRTLS